MEARLLVFDNSADVTNVEPSPWFDGGGLVEIVDIFEF
jgi:hypothetical protein